MKCELISKFFLPSSLDDYEKLFKKQGSDFLGDYPVEDDSDNTMYTGRSILEVILQEYKFDLAPEVVDFLLCYIVNNSQSVIDQKMNPLHILARSNVDVCTHEQIKGLVDYMITKNSSWLEGGLSIDENNGIKGVTPVELAIQCSYSFSFARYWIDKYQEVVGLTPESKDRLINCASGLLESSVSINRELGNFLITYIKNLKLKTNS